MGLEGESRRLPCPRVVAGVLTAPAVVFATHWLYLYDYGLEWFVVVIVVVATFVVNLLWGLRNGTTRNPG